MRCVVTAGPSYEPLDQVRRLTNFSTGRLGIELAGHLTDCGHRVELLAGVMATWPGPRRAAAVQDFATSAELAARLRGLSNQAVDAVFHAAAIGDFAFGQVWRRDAAGALQPVHGGKLSTRDGPLQVELVPTPKIIAELRAWFSRALLVGWKYEVDGDRADVLTAAQRQIRDCRLDGCVANGPAYGDGFGLVLADGASRHVADRGELFRRLEAWLRAGAARAGSG